MSNTCLACEVVEAKAHREVVPVRYRCRRVVAALLGCRMMLPSPVGAAASRPIRFEGALPYFSDEVLIRQRNEGFVRPDAHIRDDNVLRWIETARDRNRPTSERVHAVRRLHDYPQERVKRAFVSLLGDRSLPVREAAIEGLGTFGFRCTVRPLIDALGYCRGRCRQAVRDSLRRLTDNDFGNDVGAWRLWYRQHRREYR